MSEDARIEILKDALMESKLIPKAEKDALADDLEYAQTINGDPDPTRQMMKRTLISGVRREMLAYDRHASTKADFETALRSALKDHTKNCPLATSPAAKKTDADGKAGSIRIGKFFEAKGEAAKIVACVATVGVLVAGYVTWQNSKTREVIKQSLATAVEEAVKR